MIKTYNKLVRDNIINIIEADRKKCNYRILDDNEYKNHLILKLSEEVNEFMESQTVEELADIMEVIEALLNVIGSSKEELEVVKESKAIEKGRFDKKILLINVEDENV